MKTYIKNSGSTKTYIRKNKKKYVNEINWMGDYNGEEANIDVSINDNGHKDKIKMNLDNDDIMKLLNIPSIERPLDERLITDFLEPYNHSNKKKKTRKYNKRNSSNKRKSKRNSSNTRKSKRNSSTKNSE
mgnify:CR=1 FL=1